MSWKNIPQGTKSLALINVDLAPVACNWMHWAVINIPVTTDHLEEGDSSKIPAPAVELKNSFG